MRNPQECSQSLFVGRFGTIAIVQRIAIGGAEDGDPCVIAKRRYHPGMLVIGITGQAVTGMVAVTADGHEDGHHRVDGRDREIGSA